MRVLARHGLPLTVLFGFLLLFSLNASLHDPDYFWHLRTGQYLLEHLALPAGDIYSYTQPGKAWVLHEWLFEVLVYGVQHLTGDAGVRVFVALLAMGALLVAYTTAHDFLQRPILAMLVVLPNLLFIKTGAAPRPQMLTYLFLACTLHVLFRLKYFHDRRRLWVLPLLMLPWVNAHAGYFIGLVLMALFVFTQAFHCRGDGVDGQQQRKDVLHALVMVGMSVVVSLANPYTWHHWLYPFQVMAMEASRTYIQEWHSPDFHQLQYQIYLGYVLLYFVLNGFRKRRADATELVIPIVFAALGFMSVRHVPLAGLVLGVFMARAVADLTPLAQDGDVSAGKKALLWYRQHRGQELGGSEQILNGVLLVCMVLGLLAYAPSQKKRNAELLQRMVPVAAVDFMQREAVQGRLFAAYHYGGYLIYRLYPLNKVFIDGRADMYGDAFVKEYIDIYSGHANWQGLFERHAIDSALLPLDAPLRQILLAEGRFSQVFVDGHHALLVKNIPRFQRLIGQYAHQGQSSTP